MTFKICYKMRTISTSFGRAFITLALMALIPFTNINAQVQVETVDEGNNPAIYVEPDGTAHVVYFKYMANEIKLMYAKRMITGDWQHRTLGLAPYCHDLDMTMDINGNIHVVMSDNRWDAKPQTRLFHGLLTKNGTWSRKIIAVSWTRLISISLKADSKNDLHLTYLESDYPARWMEMHCIGGVWTKPSEFGALGYNCMDMALDKDDNMHVSLYNLMYGPFVYLNKPSGGDWSDPEIIDPEWGGGQLEGLVTSICTDADMNPHVSYVGSENHDSHQHTRYAWKENGEWHNSLVDRGQFQSGGNKLQIDGDGVAHLAYSYFQEDIYKPKDVRYATNLTGKWMKQTIGSQVNAINVDMGIDLNNYAHVVYGGYSQNYTEYIYYNKIKINRYFGVDPDTLDFRGVLPGGQKTIAMTFTNTLGTDVIIDSMVISDSRVTADRNNFTVAANSEETVNITMNMTSATWTNKELNIWSDGSFTVIPVLGTNYQPEVVVDPSPVDFGAILLGSSVNKTVTIKNNGMMDLNISKIEVKYEPWPGYVVPTDFSMVGHNCSQLQHWETCQVDIRFNPKKTGSQQSYLVITSNDPMAPVKKVMITGKTAHPAILSSLYDVDFGYCAVGQSITRNITIYNSGELNLVISNLAISGTHSAQFGMSHTCNQLEPGDSCKIQVTMTPAQLADLSATLTVTSNSFYSSTLNIPLHGTSLVRNLVIIPPSVDFGAVNLGDKKYALLEFKNSGSGSITISDIEITGEDRDEFFQEIACQIIAEGQSCTDTVWYIPSIEGSKSASFSVSSNDPFHPVQSIPLTGGTGPSLPLNVSIEASPATGNAPVNIDFSAVISGGQGPFWYRWDIEKIGTYTEDPDPRVLFSKPGFYTVILKLTDVNDKSDADTIEIMITSTGVPIASANAEPVSGELPLTVSFDAIVAGGNPPLAYFWNFRDGGTSSLLNPVHTYNNPGTYWARLTVTDASYDSCVDSVLITVKWNTGFSGQLWDDDGIFEIDESVVRFFPRTNIMSVWTDILEGSNQYEFNNLPQGEYSVLAIPDTAEFPQYLPTYLGRKLTLSEAQWVNMNGHITGQDIPLIRKPPQNYGNGSFWGSIGIASGKKNSSVTVEVKGDNNDTKGVALSGIYIYIKDAVSGELIDFKVTDDDGAFRFEGLENGSYSLVVDYKGLPMDPANQPLLISDEIKSAELRIIVFDNRISVVNIATRVTKLISNGIKIYPVPANEELFLEIPADYFNTLKVSCSIFDLSGRMIMNKIKPVSDGCIFSVDISALSAGVYILQLTDNKLVFRSMFVRLK